jgi:hypothetical protein
MRTPARRTIVFTALALAAAAAALAVVVAGGRPREASAAAGATPRQRCVAELFREYDSSSDPSKIVLPPRIARMVAPRVCALAEQRGLLENGVALASADAQDLTTEVVRRIGIARFQTLLFTELAFSQYHLARTRSTVTRLDRCVAMGLSAYDAHHASDAYPPRPRWTVAVRRACTTGIRRGLVPPSGAPSEPVVKALLDEALAAR